MDEISMYARCILQVCYDYEHWCETEYISYVWVSNIHWH